MRTIATLAFLFFATRAFGGIWIETVVVSTADLRAKGIDATKHKETGVISSVSIAVSIGQLPDKDHYQQTRLVVLNQPISIESLRDLDSGYDRPARRQESTKRSASFTVFGKEDERAYLAFDVRIDDDSPMAHERHYLILVSLLDEKNT